MAEGTQLPPHLLAYWSAGGKGGAEIQWGISGDFDRCITLVQEAVTKGGNAPLGDRTIKGLCATLHKINTGASPGHAAGEK
ncbi:MAG TPA: hypothetical protein VIJ31_10615 [Acidothermaceae bacterium]